MPQLCENTACSACAQGLTLLHFSGQLKRFLWDRECVKGLSRVCQVVLGGVQGEF